MSIERVSSLKKKSSRLREWLKYWLEGLKENILLLKVVAWPPIFIKTFMLLTCLLVAIRTWIKGFLENIAAEEEEFEKVILWSFKNRLCIFIQRSPFSSYFFFFLPLNWSSSRIYSVFLAHLLFLQVPNIYLSVGTWSHQKKIGYHKLKINEQQFSKQVKF